MGKEKEPKKEINPVAEKMKSQRNKLGLTQQLVATLVGINIRYYQKLEAGEKELANTSFRIGVALTKVLELDTNALIETPYVDEYLKDKKEMEEMKWR